MCILVSSCQNITENKKNTLKLNFASGDLPSLHPHILLGHIRGRVVGKALFEGLTRINPNGDAELAGASSVDISQDGLQYTFILRHHLWSDGTLVTAFQYENAWKHALSQTSDCNRADLFYVIKNAEEAKKKNCCLEDVGIHAVDEKTLLITLACPCPYFLKLLSQPMFAPLIDPKEEPTQFNGPFLVDVWDKDNFLQLKANPNYWDRKSVYLNYIHISMVQDAMTTLAMYDKKEIDWMGDPFVDISAEMAMHLEKDKEIKKEGVDRVFWIFLNTQHPILSSISIRQALNLAIDRSPIINHIFMRGSPLFKPLSKRLLPQETPSIEGNIEEAKRCFANGLKELNLTKETFPPLMISHCSEINHKKLAEYLQQVWQEAFDITIQIQGAEWNVFRSSLEKGQFEIGGCISGLIDDDPIEILQRFTRIEAFNFPKWVHSGYNEKIFLAQQESQLEKRNQLLIEAEKILMEEVPFIPICSWTHLYTHDTKLKGYVFDHTGCVDFRSAYFKTKKRI